MYIALLTDILYYVLKGGVTSPVSPLSLSGNGLVIVLAPNLHQTFFFFIYIPISVLCRVKLYVGHYNLIYGTPSVPVPNLAILLYIGTGYDGRSLRQLKF
jgi:hypothetical protein